jgi:hypothetical protein
METVAIPVNPPETQVAPLPPPPFDPNTLSPPLNVRVISTLEELELLADFFSRVDEFGFDCESQVVPFFFPRRIRTIQGRQP